MKKKLDLTPETHLLYGQMNRNISVSACLEELIDNSLDAGADRISIRHQPPTGPGKHDGILSIEDNGAGCDDVEKMLRIGGHMARGHREQSIGMYGWGLKDAATALAEILVVTTSTEEKRTDVELDWAKLAGQGWKDAITATISKPAKRPGTTVTLENLRRQIRPSELRKRLGFTFGPAILNRKRIAFFSKGEGGKIEAFKPPRLTRKELFEIPLEGRLVKGFAGIVASTQANTYDGFSICSCDRVILRTREPAGQYSTSKFYAEAHLIGDWPLSRNKDNIADEELREALFSALAKACRKILEECAKRTRNLELTKLKNLTNKLLQDVAEADKGEEEGPGPDEGEEDTSEPPGDDDGGGGGGGGNTGTRPRTGKGPGKAKNRKSPGISIDFKVFEDREQIAEVDVLKGLVIFNEESPVVKRMVSDGEYRLALAAVSHFAAECALVAPKQTLAGFGDSALERYRTALGRWQTELEHRMYGKGEGEGGE